MTTPFVAPTPHTILTIDTDPATALTIINGGLDIAIKLKSLFGGNDNNAIKKELAIIRAQNAEVLRQLATVVGILNNLGVTVREGVRDELVNLIKGQLGVALTRFYETMSVDVENPQLRRQSDQRFAELFDTFANTGRLLADEKLYGYAHFHSVGLTMMVEHWMRRRLKHPPQYWRAAALTYGRYFENALRVGETISLGSQLKAAREQFAALDAVLDAADAKIAAKFTTVRKGFSAGERNNTTRYFDLQDTAAGDRRNGYTFSSVEINVRREEHERRGRDGGDGPGGGGHLVPPPVDPGVPTVPGRVAYWNAARVAYAATLQDLTALEAAQRACQLHLDYTRQAA